MDYSRIHRLLKLIALVQSQRGWNAPALADECETSERTIYRDINALQSAGVPIKHDPQRSGYVIDGDFFMPPVQLTAEEALAISALCQHIGDPEEIPFLKPAARALHKIESQLPGAIQRELAEHSRHLAVQTAPMSPLDGHADLYDRAQQALRQRRVLRCCYEPVSSAHDESESEFELEPHCLFFSVRAWYLVGRRSDRDNAFRSLKLNRFLRMELTDRTFTPDDSFDLSDILGNAWRMIPSGDDVDITLHISPQFAQTISETHWHRTQHIDWHDDDSCTFRCTVAGTAEIEWWILSMGPHCTVLDPPDLADRIAQLASGTAALYHPET